ncbi:hypothetical protein RhiirA4_499236 [Rhizophagus irregularis]|uniref:Uncharacterized protein n=1 Tax=Rhizophagus irregularis TaxID=588596 RepID=A0A2I1H3V1_9GLOM|nr:hypothetical protein RhiirA4_499236 [Rhizophagus irregularis]
MMKRSRRGLMTTRRHMIDPFYDIYDYCLVDVVKCKKIEEYIEVEEKLIGPVTISKPGKIPVRLNKPETKVPAVYYFVSLFLIKWAGKALKDIMEALLYRERIAALKYEQIKMQNAKILEKNEDLTKKLADSDLINGLMIADTENRIRNLEADVIAKERIILEKNEANNLLWEKIKALEVKEEKPTCQVCLYLNLLFYVFFFFAGLFFSFAARYQQNKNGMIIETKLGAIGDVDKDRLEKHFADRPRDITFYDIPAYWSDAEIFELLNANVGFVEYMRTKRCYKYKTVRVTLRFSNAYEKIYKEGGVYVSLTRKNRTSFLRMFDSRLSYGQIKDKFRWQATKRLESDVQQDDILVIKDFVKTYHGFFGKIIRVKGIRFIILYFNKELDLMNAINESIKLNDIGHGLWIKKQSDFIDDKGELQEFIGGPNYQNKASRSNGVRMEWEQQSGTSTHFAPSRIHKQWR